MLYFGGSMFTNLDLSFPSICTVMIMTTRNDPENKFVQWLHEAGGLAAGTFVLEAYEAAPYPTWPTLLFSEPCASGDSRILINRLLEHKERIDVVLARDHTMTRVAVLVVK